MLQKLTLPFLIILVILGAVLRSYNLPGRATFEWDQERDHQAVTAMVTAVKPPLVGPVIQGQGGFMLGPLYYYLLTPSYLLLSGNPLSSFYLSIFLDLVLVLGLYFLGNRYLGRPAGLIAGLLWVFSAYAIRLSLVSWNVSLVPLYTLGSLGLGLALHQSFRLRYFWAALFWLGLAWHVHPSVIFQIPVALLLSWPHLRPLRPKAWLFGLGCFLLPLSPWAIFDLRHSFTNTKLLFGFLSQSSVPSALGATLVSIWQKYAFELSQLLVGRQLFALGSVLIIGELVYLLFSRKYISRFLGLNLVFSFLALLLMRNEDFGNYYLLNLAIINVWLIVDLLHSYRAPLRWGLLIGFLLLNLKQYNFTTGPYSLAVKQEVLTTIAAWHNPVDLEISLPVGRRSAFDWYLVHSSILRHDDNARDVAYIVESDQLEITAPEKARSIVIEQTIGGFRFVGYQGY